jgi:hypothetical protein
MYRKLTFSILLLGALSLSFLTACHRDVLVVPDVVNKPTMEFYGLTADNMLIRYNSNNVSAVLGKVAISGLQTGEKIMAIDFRPATGQLYGLGSGSRLYVINPSTGAASAVGAAAFTPALSGTMAGFDFNPTVDRIRVVTSSGQNLRLNPETGTVAATDAMLNPGTPSVVGAAYSNSVAGASTTVLYDIDITAGKLYKQMPPNDGVLVEVGPLGVSNTGECGFDISPDNGVALATFMNDGYIALHQIDLATGKASFLGYPLEKIIGIAIPSMPVAYAVDMMNNLQIFNFRNPSAAVSKAITGLQAGEKILGIDMRPATGQLYALGSSSRLYTINMSSGAATMVGSMPFATLLDGSSFGFDFNPVVDRIRVVSNTGQNLRLNPADGTVAAVDMPLNPGTPMISSAAYTNNFAGATSTVLYDIDPLTDKLYKQLPPNDGTLVEVGSLQLDVINDNGFDIGGTSNMAYALLPTIGSAKIYSINLSTGVATPIADFPNAISGFAIGLGF